MPPKKKGTTVAKEHNVYLINQCDFSVDDRVGKLKIHQAHASPDQANEFAESLFEGICVFNHVGEDQVKGNQDSDKPSNLFYQQADLNNGKSISVEVVAQPILGGTVSYTKPKATAQIKKAAPKKKAKSKDTWDEEEEEVGDEAEDLHSDDAVQEPVTSIVPTRTSTRKRKAPSPFFPTVVKRERKSSLSPAPLSERNPSQSADHGASSVHIKPDHDAASPQIKPDNDVSSPQAIPKPKRAPKRESKHEPKQEPISNYNEDDYAGITSNDIRAAPFGNANSLSSLSFHLIGIFHHWTPSQITSMIEFFGGTVHESYSEETSYVLVGIEHDNEEVQKIKEEGKHCISQDSLYRLIRDTSGGEMVSSREVARVLQGCE